MSANSAAAHRLPELGPRFERVSWLAGGGQGGVARARLGGRAVVLKAIDGSLALDASAVFGVLQSVASPHLPDAIELAREASGTTWLVTAFLEGMPLAPGPASIDVVLDEAIGVAHALAALHQAGTHHGDVSSSNVLRTSTGGVVLTDLGTLGAKGVGTPGYLAPESLSGQGGPAADRYALGALMSARLFGVVPWTRPELLVALRSVDVMPRLRELAAGEAAQGLSRGPAFEPTLRLMARLLDPDPGERPDDAIALLHALETLRTYARAGGLARGLTQWAPPRRWPLFGGLGPQLRQLAAAWQEAKGPRLTVVFGPSGSGRGRVVRELAAYLQRAGVAAQALDADAFDTDVRGDWLAGWLGDGSERPVAAKARPAVDPALCTQAPNWPERFEGEDHADTLALRLAVLRAGARLGTRPLVLVVDQALGEALAQVEAAGASEIRAIRVTPLSRDQVRAVLEPVLRSPELRAFAELAHVLSEGWPAALVRCVRAAARMDLQRPDPSAWRAELEGDAPTMQVQLARRVLFAAWGIERGQLPPRVEHRGQPLAWAVRAARATLGPTRTDIARACARQLRSQDQPLPLALALELDRPDAVQAALATEPLTADVQDTTGERLRLAQICTWLEARGVQGVDPQLVLQVAVARLDAGEPQRAAALVEPLDLLRVHEGVRLPLVAQRELVLARSDLRRGEVSAALARLEADAPSLGPAVDAGQWPGRGARLALEHTALRLRALTDTGDHAGAAAWADAVEATTVESEFDSATLRAWASATAWAGYARMLGGAGDAHVRAARLLDTAIAALANGNTPSDAAVRGRALQLRGNLARMEGDERRGRQHYAAAAAAFRRAGEAAAALWLEGNLAVSALSAGELGLAAKRGRNVVRALMARGELQSLSVLLWNTCEALACIGADEEAAQLCVASGALLDAAKAPALERARVHASAAMAAVRRAAREPHSQALAEASAQLGQATRNLAATGGQREATATACACAALARVRGDARDSATWIQQASQWAAQLDDPAVALECAVERLEFARRFGGAAALAEAADALASRPDTQGAAARGERLLAWKIDRALLRAVLALHGTQHPAVHALRRRAINHLEQMMTETPSQDRNAARQALATEFGDTGPLEDLLRDLAEGAAPDSAADAKAAPASAAAPQAQAPVDDLHEPRAMRLLKMYRRLAREDDLERLLGQVCDAMMELTDAERGVVVVRSGDTHLELAREFSESDTRGPNFSRSIIEKVLETGAPLLSVDASEDARFGESKSISHLNLRSVVAVPLRFRGDVLGAAYVDHRLRRGAFAEGDLALMEDFAELAGLAVANAHALREARQQAESLAREQSELSSLLDLREAEVQGLRETIRQQRDERSTYRGMIGSSPAMQKLYRLVDRLSDSTVPVVIYGESGTGKELVARALHDAGSRAAAPFVAENCGAIPETLLESVFFGHARGAFTGANTAKPGLFEAADGGTIFLDEIGEMSASMQTKLLRVLQEGEVRRVGENKTRKVDVRVVAASNKDLQALVEAGSFRRDLFYRINVVRLELPPLRDRREDVIALVSHFLERYGAPKLELSATAKRQLLRYPWPGNVRELENEVQRWVALVEDRVRPEDLAAAISGADGAVDDPDDLRIKPRIESMERALIARALERSSGNQTHAAELLGLSRYGLQKKLKRLEAGSGKGS